MHPKQEVNSREARKTKIKTILRAKRGEKIKILLCAKRREIFEKKKVRGSRASPARIILRVGPVQRGSAQQSYSLRGSRVEGTMLENNCFFGGSRGRGGDLGIIFWGGRGLRAEVQKIKSELLITLGE